MYTADSLLDKVNAYIAALHFSRPPQGLYTPIEYVLSMGGKRIRPVLMLMAYNLYREDVEHILSEAVGIETYHNYTLLHDDLMDRADRRRGKETVHKLWGDNTAILSGDAMLVLAYQYMMAQCPSEYVKEVVGCFSQTALEICEGQQLDMEFENRENVSEEEYLEMIRLKTSVLLAAALKIGAVLGGASQEDTSRLYDFGVNLGLAFQLQDDMLDVYGNPEVFGKNIGGDILANKKTFLLIKAFEHANPQQLAALNDWMAAKSYCAAEKISAVTALYNEIDVRKLCEDKIAACCSRAEECLSEVAVDEKRKGELLKMLRTLQNREV